VELEKQNPTSAQETEESKWRSERETMISSANHNTSKHDLIGQDKWLNSTTNPLARKEPQMVQLAHPLPSNNATVLPATTHHTP
jgi:hypothetical protein